MNEDSFRLPSVSVLIKFLNLRTEVELIEGFLRSEKHHSFVLKLPHELVKVDLGVRVDTHFDVTLLFSIELYA